MWGGPAPPASDGFAGAAVLSGYFFDLQVSNARAAHRSSRAGKIRNPGEVTFAGGEHRDDTATPAKPSLTGGAGPHTYPQL